MSKERTYTFRNGLTVRLRKVGKFMLSRLMVSNADSIEVPYKILTYGTRKEEKPTPDYNNPVYMKLVEEQLQKDQAETLGNISSLSVIDNIPEDEKIYYYSIAKATRENFDENFAKSLWLLDNVEDEEELTSFQEAILGITEPTARGVEVSEEKFQSTD